MKKKLALGCLGVTVLVIVVVVVAISLSSNEPSTSSPVTPGATVVGASTTVTKSTKPTIYITYSVDKITRAPSSWSYADAGYTYLVLDLIIENQGYDSFSTNSLYWYVLVNNVKYQANIATGLPDELKLLDVLSGGKVQGTLAFEVPTDVEASGFQIQYDAWRSYHIQWIKQ